MHEAMEMGFTYRALEELVVRGEVLTRRAGKTVLYAEGSLERCRAAAGLGLTSGA
jgi:hypothetical protein